VSFSLAAANRGLSASCAQRLSKTGSFITDLVDGRNSLRTLPGAVLKTARPDGYAIHSKIQRAIGLDPSKLGPEFYGLAMNCQ
jgi:hypothetical protein